MFSTLSKNKSWMQEPFVFWLQNNNSIPCCTHLSHFCPSSNKLLHLILSWAISSWRRARRKQHWRSQFIALSWRCIIIRWMLMSTVALCIQDLHCGFWCTDWTNSILLDGIHLYTNGEKPAVFQNTTWYAENKHIFKTFGKSCMQSTIYSLLHWMSNFKCDIEVGISLITHSMTSFTFWKFYAMSWDEYALVIRKGACVSIKIGDLNHPWCLTLLGPLQPAFQSQI